MPHNLLTIRLQNEHDVVLARQRASQVASLLGFGPQDQSRIATAVSEIARNAFEYAYGGTITFRLVPKNSSLHIEVLDRGTGIAPLDEVLTGNYKSSTGMGMGIIGARRLMDTFHITSSLQGTTVTMEKRLPPRVTIDTPLLQHVSEGLMHFGDNGILSEVQKHNQEMLQAMTALQEQQQQLLELNRELEDTNRGVVALYAELDERAELLRKSNETKSRFLSTISHELRTPLNAILSLSGLLLGRVDGELTEEQEKQATYIRRSAESLAELVNDLLDLSKVEAGKVIIRPETFEINTLFSALRGMLRPLLSESQKVNLLFEADSNLPALTTDEGKLSQILRNFISNAIKFTSEGEVSVSALHLDGDRIRFAVTDTGIGIADQDLDYIFEEFTQVEGPLHKKSKGTGLGLPLARKLAELLGGEVGVESVADHGSTFYCIIPRVYAGSGEGNVMDGKPPVAAVRDTGSSSPATALIPLPHPARILIIDNDPAHIYLLRTKLAGTHHEIMEAPNGASGLEIARTQHPDLIFLDLVMPQMDGFTVLEVLRSQDKTREIPVIIHTSKTLTLDERQYLMQHASAILSKDEDATPAAAERFRRLLEEVLKRGA